MANDIKGKQDREKIKAKLHLECVLTEKETLDYSRQLGEAIRAKGELQGHIKTFSAQKKAEIAAADATISKMSQLVNTGKEFRSVECTVRYDWKGGFKQYIRLDTNQPCKEESIKEDERQEELGV